MIYLTGASGRLGKEVLERIAAVPLVRKPSGLKNEVVTTFGAEELKRLLKDADCVIHLAGSMDFMDMKALWAANVELTGRIVDALPPTCRMVFASSISVYGKDLAELPADEETQVKPDSPYSKSKLEAERIVLKHANSVILRIATIYGPGFEDYPRILRQIRKGTMRIIGDGKNRIPFVHVKDVADAVKNSTDAKVKPGVYVLAGEALTQEQIMRLSAKLLGVDAPAEHLPLNAALMFAKFEESKSFMAKQKPKMTAEHVFVLASDRAFDCSKAKRSLRFRPRRLEDGIREIVEGMK